MKVVCVDATPRRGYEHVRFPVTGEIYTIRAIYPPDFQGDTAIVLEEILNGAAPLGREYSFFLHRFRPLTARKTEAEDAAFFRDWLRAPHVSATERERADV